MDVSKAELMALIAMTFGLFMDGLDASIVNIALPSIAESFGTDTNAVAWITISYFMVIAGTMLIFGRLADSGHIRKIYIAGFAIFAGASFFCGIADNLIVLVVARCVQGVGAAMLAAVAPMICVKFISPNKLGVAMGAFILAGAVGFGCGPTLGGIIVDIASWHWCFLINVPIGIIAILVALRGLPKDHDISKARLDLKGSALLAIAVISGVYILEMFTREGQSMICLVLGIVMIVCILLFIHVEGRAEHPMLNVKTFRDWRYDAALICYLTLNIAYMGIYYILPFYMTMELGLGFTFAGLIILIPSILTMVFSLPAGLYCDLHGRRTPAIISTVFLLLASIGYLLQDPAVGWIMLIPASICSGIVWCLCGSSVATRIIDLAPPEEKGMASTLQNFTYYVGGSIGTALFATLLTFGAGTVGIPIEDMTSEAFMNGYTFTMIIACLISIIPIVTAWIVKYDTVSDTSKSKKSSD